MFAVVEMWENRWSQVVGDQSQKTACRFLCVCVCVCMQSCNLWLVKESVHQCPLASLYLPVPIIPSYLYHLDESTDTMFKNDTLSQQSPPAAFHSIVSLYDNTVRSSSSNTTARSTDLAPTSPATTALPQNSSECPQSTSKLLNENVKVGMLFASKATVQLLTNPFIGPLTNR